MAISVTDLGAAHNSSGATVTLSPVTVSSGSLIVVCACDEGFSGPVSVSDGSNTYHDATANVFVVLQYAWNVSALTGATITYTKSLSGAPAAISAFYATGIQSSADPFDAGVKNSANGSGTAPSVTSGSASVAGELFVGMVAAHGNGGAFTQDSGHAWATPPDESATGTTSADARVDGGHFVNPGTGSLTYAPTFASSVALWEAFICGFKSTAPPPPVPSFGWFEPLSDPSVKTLRGLLPSEQQFLAFHPVPVVPFGWFEPMSEPSVKTLRGLAASLQQFTAMPSRLLPTPTVTGIMHAFETKDTFLAGGMMFNQPVSGEVGVIETRFQGMPGVIEKPAPGAAAISGGSISVRVASS